MTFSRTATCDYSGKIMEGSGTTKAGSGAFSAPVSFPKRIGDALGATSPEELVAAAHATCYAMVVTGALGRAEGVSWSALHITCTITANKGDEGIRVKTSNLEATVEGLKGLDAAGFDTLAKKAEEGCPISIMLRPSLAIDVKTRTK